MRRVNLFFAAVVAVVVLGWVALAYFPLITGTTAQQSQTITAIEANHCGIMSTSPVSVGSMTLQLESDTNASVGSKVCIHATLTNTGITPINLNNYVMNISVTDSSGKQVFNDQIVVLYEPATLTSGNSWDGITYWNTAATPNSPGAYTITVDLFSVVTNQTEISTSATVTLSPGQISFSTTSNSVGSISSTTITSGSTITVSVGSVSSMNSTIVTGSSTSSVGNVSSVSTTSLATNTTTSGNDTALFKQVVDLQLCSWVQYFRRTSSIMPMSIYRFLLSYDFFFA